MCVHYFQDQILIIQNPVRELVRTILLNVVEASCDRFHFLFTAQSGTCTENTICEFIFKLLILNTTVEMKINFSICTEQ